MLLGLKEKSGGILIVLGHCSEHIPLSLPCNSRLHLRSHLLTLRPPIEWQRLYRSAPVKIFHTAPQLRVSGCHWVKFMVVHSHPLWHTLFCKGKTDVSVRDSMKTTNPEAFTYCCWFGNSFSKRKGNPWSLISDKQLID